MEARRPLAATAAVIRLFSSMDDVDPTLRTALEQGTYVVDPRAVADAILRHHEQLGEARRLARVLVAADLDGPAAGRAQCDPPAGADVA
jgi:hypothetical protein